MDSIEEQKKSWRNTIVGLEAENAQLKELLVEARDFIDEITSMTGKYPYVNGTELVRDAYDASRKITNTLERDDATSL